jgi:ubiquinone/menaquinone biosynthesis C-methylase UbiE
MFFGSRNLRERRNTAHLIQKEGLSDIITLREGNAEALPFPDNEFDVVMRTICIMALNLLR